MFQRILVPLDGSSRAERAIPVAARVARASGGTVILVRAISTVADLWSSDTTQTHPAEIERYLTEARAASHLAGVATEIIALSDSAASAILHTAYTSQADLIILCSHGYRGTARRVMGSVAETVAYHALAPVLILSEEGPILESTHPDTMRPLRALVPQDGSPLSVAALEPAAFLIAALAAPATGALHLVWVVNPASTESEAYQLKHAADNKHALDNAKQNLNAIVKQLHERLATAGADLKLTITWSVVLNTEVASTLISLAENGEDAGGASTSGACDVIAMATHGHSGMERWVFGGTTLHVLNTTRLPLLVIRPLDMEDKSHFTWDEATITSLLELS